jgi:hypothetical protein
MRMIFENFECPICGGPTSQKEQKKTLFKIRQVFYACINPDCGTRLSHDFDEKKNEFMDGLFLFETKRKNDETWKLFRYKRLPPEQWKTARTPDAQKAFIDLSLWGTHNPILVCPHCQTKGFVHTKPVNRKAGISGGKATGAILTGGVSLLATGLSRSETATQVHCINCNMTWDV